MNCHSLIAILLLISSKCCGYPSSLHISLPVNYEDITEDKSLSDNNSTGSKFQPEVTASNRNFKEISVDSLTASHNTFPDSGRKSPVLESAAKESLPIQLDIKYGNIQQLAGNILNAKPLLDTIQEHEKYGNDGSKGRSVATFLVDAFETLSNTLNTIVDLPVQSVKAIGGKITASLNMVGEKLVGLAK